MAYNGMDGAPRAIPIGYLWNGAGFVMCTASSAPKVRALQANPKAALTIDTDTRPPHILLVRGTISVEIVDGVPTEYLRTSWKSVPEEQRPAFEEQVRATYKQMARITLMPEWAKLIDFETRLPIAVQHLVSGRRQRFADALALARGAGGQPTRVGAGASMAGPVSKATIV